jgi:hypothetical protein
MEKTTNLIKGKKYRVVTEWGEHVMTFWGIMVENGNPIFLQGVFPTQIIPWTAIKRIELIEE